MYSLLDSIEAFLNQMPHVMYRLQGEITFYMFSRTIRRL